MKSFGDSNLETDSHSLRTTIQKEVGEERLESVERRPTFVVAQGAPHSGNDPKPEPVTLRQTLLRSYKCKGFNPTKCASWEAAYAAIAIPPLESVPIEALAQQFSDSGAESSNPSRIALLEVARIWNSIRQVCLVSVGTCQAKSIIADNEKAKKYAQHAATTDEYLRGQVTTPPKPGEKLTHYYRLDINDSEFSKTANRVMQSLMADTTRALKTLNIALPKGMIEELGRCAKMLIELSPREQTM